MKITIAVLLLLFGAAFSAQIQHKSKLQNLIQSTLQTKQQAFSCTTAIERYKAGSLADDYKTIIKNGTNYRDQVFPAGPTAVQWPGFTWNSLSQGSLTWNRATKLNPFATMFGSSGFSNDVSQGQIADCFFLGGLSAVAEDEQRIKKAFITEEKNDAGIYAFNVFVRGLPTIVTIDEYLLTANGNGQFARISEDGSMWVPLLEKVWAKVNGNYERIQLGFGVEPVSFLTNSPSTQMPLSYLNLDQLYQMVDDADSNENMMTATTPGTSDIYRCNLNLPCNHVHTVLDAVTLVSSKNNSVKFRLYKIRNPWGVDADFAGKWKDNAAIWTADGETYDKQAGRVIANDGIVWVEEQEFKDTFYYVEVAVYKKDWQYSWYNKENDDGTRQNYTFSIDKDTPLILRLQTYSPRMYGLNCKPWQNQETKFEVKLIQINDNGEEIKILEQKTMSNYEQNNWIDNSKTPLSAGKYRVSILPSYLYCDVKDYTLSIRSAQAINITDSNGKTNQTRGVSHDFTYKTQPDANKAAIQRIIYPEDQKNLSNCNMTGNLTLDLVKQRNAKGLVRGNLNPNIYTLTKQQVLSTNQKELIVYVGSVSRAYIGQIQVNLQAAYGISVEYNSTISQCTKLTLDPKPTEIVSYSCTCNIDGDKQQYECGFASKIENNQEFYLSYYTP